MATTPTYLRENQCIIHAGVDSVAFPATHSWTTFQGGDVEATNIKTRPGGGLPEIDIGGPATRTDVTVTRQYTPELHGFIVDLENSCGKRGAFASYTPIDADNNPNGPTITLKGILKSVMHPNFDANAANPAFLSLVISVNQEAVVS